MGGDGGAIALKVGSGSVIVDGSLSSAGGAAGGAGNGGIAGVGKGNAMATVLQFVVMPLVTMVFGLALPMILDRRADIAAAFNDIGKRIFTKDALMWWIVGFVFATIASGGFFVCGFGFLVTFPWIISSFAVAYSSLFGLDDPNRTNN